MLISIELIKIIRYSPLGEKTPQFAFRTPLLTATATYRFTTDIFLGEGFNYFFWMALALTGRGCLASGCYISSSLLLSLSSLSSLESELSAATGMTGTDLSASILNYIE